MVVLHTHATYALISANTDLVDLLGNLLMVTNQEVSCGQLRPEPLKWFLIVFYFILVRDGLIRVTDKIVERITIDQVAVNQVFAVDVNVSTQTDIVIDS